MRNRQQHKRDDFRPIAYRTHDAGKSWRRTNSERKLRQRAWYYTHVFADPQGADTVYVLNVGLFRSKDGGTTFEQIRAPHGDNHDLWIAPEDPQRMVNGNDGGATVSLDGGRSWSTVDNQPTAQIYHVATDDRVPYFVYGAQQDNSTVALPSGNVEGGIDRSVWYPVGGCESGYVAPRRDDPQVVFAGCYGGQITRYDRRTGQVQNVSPRPLRGDGYRVLRTQPAGPGTTREVIGSSRSGARVPSRSSASVLPSRENE